MSDKPKYVPLSYGTVNDHINHWADYGTKNLKEYKKGVQEWGDYIANEKAISEAIPPYLREELVESGNKFKAQINDIRNSPEFMEQYGRDPWSAAGIKKLREQEIHVPLGYGRSGALMEGNILGSVGRRGVFGEERMFMAGGAKGSPRDGTEYENLAGTLRHEGTHLLQVGLNEEKRVRALDAIYNGDTGKKEYSKFYGEDANPKDWDNLRSHLNYGKKHQTKEEVKSYGPGEIREMRKLTKDDPRLKNLSDDDYLAVLRAAGSFDNIRQDSATRSLPGDTTWGDFVRYIEDNVVGERDITKSMKAWTEVPTRERNIP